MKVKIVVPSNDLETKGLGRIFVQKPEDVDKVEALLKEYDPNEFEGYYPKGLVTTFNCDGDNPYIYTHKFDIKDVNEFINICRQNDIYIIIRGRDAYTQGPTDDMTLERDIQMKLGLGKWLDDFTYNKTKDW